MQFTSWLRSFVGWDSVPTGSSSTGSGRSPNLLRALRRHSRRNRAESRVAVVERLEDRSLLSVAALFVGGELFVSSDGGDSITIRQNTNSRVEILANGAILGTAPNVLTSAVTSIVVKGGDEANVIDLNAVTNATYPNITSIRIDSGNGDDVIVGSPSFGDSVLAGDGRDSVSGQGGNDTLDGGDGNDTLQGQDGDDSLIGEDGSDSLSGGVGNDTISGGDHPDTISGGDGNDVVDAGLSGDSVNGDNGNDTLNGMDGTDTLSGDAGDDSIFGGAGSDSLLGGDGDDVIDAQAGNDTLLGEAGDDSLAGGTGFDSVAGGVGQDFLNGGANDDTLVGGADHDTELGGAGNDVLYGDEVTPQPASVGNDVLNGQSGNDTVDGGGGNDQLDGGTGNDLLQPNTVDLSASALLLSIDDASVVEGDAGITNVSVTVRLSHSSVEPVTVDYATADDIAAAGADYQAVSGTLIFAAGQTVRTIAVPVRGEVSFEASENIFVNLSNSFGAIVSDAQAVVTIMNDDAPAGLPQVTIDDVVVNPEFDGPASFGFGPPTRFAVAGNVGAHEIATGDFNGDGNVDLVTTNRDLLGGQSVSIHFNAGNGTFPTRTDFPVTVTGTTRWNPSSIVTGDFDGDLDLDFAIVNPIQSVFFVSTVAVFLNDGSGVFIQGPINSVGNFADGIAGGDVDGDGDFDLITCNANDDTVSVLRNNGDGTFASRIDFPTGDTPRDITLADLDGDSDLDVITANAIGGLFFGANVSILLNNGSGSFGPPTTITLTNVRNTDDDVLAVDVDGDNDIDIVTTNSGSNNFSVLLNNGNATFGAPTNFSTGSAPNTAPTSAVARDFDGDGDFDLAFGFGFGGAIAVCLNNGSGSFAAALNFTTINNPPASVASSDFDGDGFDDLAVIRGGENFGEILLNDRDPSVFATLTVSLSAPSLVSVTVTATTANGSASSGNDYQVTTVPLVFAPGTLSQTVTVPVISDTLDEANENFFINLSAPVNATIGDSQGQVTIVDDDGGVIGVPALTISDVTLAEGNAGTTNFVFNVTLARPAGNNSVVTVEYQTADDSATSGGPQPDYVAAGPLTLTFGAGVTVQQLVIPVNGDVFVEPDEAFVVNLLNPVGAILTDSRAVGLIQDDDGGPPTPLVLVNDVLIDETNSGVVSAVVTVTLSSPAPAAVSINLSTADGSARAGSDYSATTTTINIPIGGMSGSASIPILGDTRDELAEFFTVNLLSATGGLLTASSLQVTIRDDDGATFLSPNDCLLIGGDGNDTLNAGLGNDTLNGGLGADAINGGSGNDSILGGAGTDTINGEAGNDTINGQGGADQINSGTGDDLFVWEGGVSGKDTLSNESGGDGVLVSLNGTNNSAMVAETPIPLAGTFGFMTITESGVTMTIDSSIDHVTIDGGNGDDTITVADLEKVNQTLLTIRGGEGNDFLTAGLTANTGLVRLRLEGGNGDDTLFGGAGHDTLLGEAGMDRIRGGAGHDQAIGGSGIDSINGEEGNDTLIGGNGSDTLVGDGADSLDGDAGDDSIRGDQGNDLLTGDLGNDTVRGGDGNDTISGDEGDDSLLGDTALDSISGGDGNDTIDGGRNDDFLNGGAGNDKIRGDHGNDAILGGAGDDTINGGDGDDVIGGQSGNDLMTGADGQDTVNGGVGNDIITGGDGDDSLLGSDGNDIVLGDQGDDLVNGQISTDTLAGGQGDDTIVAAAAGEIDETFVLSAALLSALNAM